MARWRSESRDERQRDRRRGKLCSQARRGDTRSRRTHRLGRRRGIRSRGRRRTAGGAGFAFSPAGGTPVPGPVNVSARGAAFSFTGGGATPAVLVGQTLQVGGAAFRILVGGVRPRSSFTYGLDDTAPFTFTDGSGFTYGLDDTKPFTYEHE
jgi:hypothetical protein